MEKLAIADELERAADLVEPHNAHWLAYDTRYAARVLRGGKKDPHDAFARAYEVKNAPR